MDNRLLRINPEFARNVRLELSTRRLVMMPAILLLLSMLALNSDYGIDNEQVKYTRLAYYAIVAMVFITTIWGAKAAADGLTEEHNSNTWDWQRVTLMSPQKLALGKLFGSTVFQWYGGICCAVIYLFATMFTDSNFLNNFIRVLQLSIVAVGAQGLAVMITLMQMKNNISRGKMRSSGAVIIGILSASFFFTGELTAMPGLIADDIYQPEWFGLNLGWFGPLFKSLFFSAWILAGVYRMMRNELQYINGITWWLGFLVSLLIYFAGFTLSIKSIDLTTTLIAITFMVAGSSYLAITYSLLLVEPKDFQYLRKVWKSIKNRDFKSYAVEAPLWLTSLFFTALCAFACIIFFENSSTYNNNTPYFNDVFDNIRKNSTLVPLAILGFLLRDVGIILSVNLAGRPKKSLAVSVLFLILLYVIIPAILSSASALYLFYPIGLDASFVMAPYIEAIFVWMYLIYVWKGLNSKYPLT